MPLYVQSCAVVGDGLKLRGPLPFCEGEREPWTPGAREGDGGYGKRVLLMSFFEGKGMPVRRN